MNVGQHFYHKSLLNRKPMHAYTKKPSKQHKNNLQTLAEHNIPAELVMKQGTI